MNKIYLSSPCLSGEEISEITEALDSNFVAPVGPKIEEFEQAICTYTGIFHGAATCSGTSAIHLALRLLEVSQGDRVYVSNFSFIASAAPIVQQGATPVFIDCEEKRWGMCPELLTEQLSEDAKNNQLPKAIIVAHVYGHCADMTPLLEAAKEYNIPVIEDAAEGLASYYDGKHSGHFSVLSALSFNGNKMITTGGGGMLLSNDKAYIDRAKHLSKHARIHGNEFIHTDVCYNYRMSNISASIGCAQLRQLDRYREKKHFINNLYKSLLSNKFSVHCPDSNGSHWLSCITTDAVSPKTIADALEKENIESRHLWVPLHEQPCFQGAEYITRGVSKHLHSTGLCLPSDVKLEESDIHRIVKIVESVA